MMNLQKSILYVFIALFTYVNVEFYHCGVVYAGSAATSTSNGSSKLHLNRGMYSSGKSRMPST